MRYGDPVYPNFKEYKEIKSKKIGWYVSSKLNSGIFGDFQALQKTSGSKFRLESHSV